MGSVTRRIKRNIAENRYGIRACTVRGIKKKLALLEEEIGRKSKNILDPGGECDEETPPD